MATQIKKLTPYAERRNFGKTPEPEPKTHIQRTKNPLFVIQEHHASHLHWDLRLEINDVLKSWAVPKGPSINPTEKRLAILTEDHPLEYAHFEGTIPEGLYGAGTVMVWDIGTYINEKTIPMDQCFDEGRIEITVKGKKLLGTFALIRLKSSEKNWIFFKIDDAFAHTGTAITKTHNKSALTGRTVVQIAQEVKKSHE